MLDSERRATQLDSEWRTPCWLAFLRGGQIVQAHELVGGKHPGGKVIVTF